MESICRLERVCFTQDIIIDPLRMSMPGHNGRESEDGIKKEIKPIG